MESPHQEFDAWLRWAFDHPVTDPAWYWNENVVAPSPTTCIDHLIQLFRSSAALLQDFSNGQVNQGLWFLSSNACSVHTDAFIDHAVPLERRLVGVEAVYALYRDLFATRCSPELSHGRGTGKPAGNPLNSVCFMFWDIGSLLAADEAPMQAAILDVLQRIAKLGHVACIEGAVHGLGHAALCGYVETSGKLDNMISSSSCPSEIIPYARKAKDGDIE